MTRWWRMLYNNSGLCSKKNRLMIHNLWTNRWRVMTNHQIMIIPKLLMKHEFIISKSVLIISAWWSRKNYLKMLKIWSLTFFLGFDAFSQNNQKVYQSLRGMTMNITDPKGRVTFRKNSFWYTDLEDIFARVARQLVWRYLSFTLDKLYWIVLTITKIIRLPSVIFSIRGLQ